jgi:hypothetical protein
MIKKYWIVIALVLSLFPWSALAEDPKLSAVLEGIRKRPFPSFRRIRLRRMKAGIQEIAEVLDPGDPVPAKAGSRGDDSLRNRRLEVKLTF